MAPPQVAGTIKSPGRLARKYKYVEATMVDTHVLNRGGRGVESPFDRLG